MNKLNKAAVFPKRIEFPTKVIAFINIEPEELSKKIQGGLEFSESYDDLDYIRIAYFKVQSGRTYGLIRHKNNPVPGTEILTSRFSRNIRDDIKEVLTHFKLQPSIVSWVSLDVEETSTEKLIEINIDLIISYNNRGLIYHDLNQLEKALEDYSIAIKLAEDFADIKDINDIIAGLYANRGRVYSDLNQLENALEDYNAAIKMKPNLAIPFNNRAEVFFKLGEFGKAIDDCIKAISIDPNVAEFYNSLGIIYFNIKKVDDAITNFKKALDIDPSLADAEYNLNVAIGLKKKRTP